MSLEIFCFGALSSGRISGVGSALVAASSAASSEGGRSSASLEAASENMCTCWCGVDAMSEMGCIGNGTREED